MINLPYQPHQPCRALNFQTSSSLTELIILGALSTLQPTWHALMYASHVNCAVRLASSTHYFLKALLLFSAAATLTSLRGRRWFTSRPVGSDCTTAEPCTVHFTYSLLGLLKTDNEIKTPVPAIHIHPDCSWHRGATLAAPAGRRLLKVTSLRVKPCTQHWRANDGAQPCKSDLFPTNASPT